VLSNKRKSHEFGITELELELIPLLGSSDGASQTTRAPPSKFISSAELLSGIMGSVIHSCHYLFYRLWLPGFHLHKARTHTLFTPGPLCTCINHHCFSSKAESAIHPNAETTKSNCISNFLVCQISLVQK